MRPLNLMCTLFYSTGNLEKKEMAIQERTMPIKHLREKRKAERLEIEGHGKQY